MKEQELEKIIQKYFEFVNGERLEDLLTLFHEDAEFTTPGKPILHGKTDIGKFYQGVYRNYPDHDDAPTEIYIKGNRTAVEISFVGKSKKGQEIKFLCVDIFQFEGDKIWRLQTLYDGYQLLKDLGVLK